MVLKGKKGNGKCVLHPKIPSSSRKEGEATSAVMKGWSESA